MNLRHYFYRGYYEGLNYRLVATGRAKNDTSIGSWFAEKNQRLLRYTAPESAIQLLSPHENGLHELQGYTELVLQTGGQGLLTGTGYTHETGSLGELKLGFYFDPTSGLPTLPGHSVKGVLRAAFPIEQESVKVQEAKAKWIASILSENDTAVPKTGVFAFVEHLKKAIFEGGTEQPMAQHDVFLEAAMTRAGVFMGHDALAPHDRKTDGIKNPVPIAFVKVLPGIPFRFAFLLKPSVIDGVEISVAAKKALFKTILTTLGAGAKTRNGYGIFEQVKAIKIDKSGNDKPQDILSGIGSNRYKQLPLTTTQTYEAVANGQNDKGKTRFVLLIGEAGKGITFTQKWPETLEPGMVIQVKLKLNMNGQIDTLIHQH